MRSLPGTGNTVAGFVLESVVGEGAMGTVFRARRHGSHEPIAVKVLSSELTRDERFRRRFLQEARLVGGLDHPHVVSPTGFGEEDGSLYLTMPYFAGGDLRRLLRAEGRLEPQRALRLIAEVAEALDHAHAAGIVHRDVKPGNILVSTPGGVEHAYVCDFGLARHVASTGSLTGERGFVGTVDYISPEQVLGSGVDARADVYSLACVLFECLAGRPPFARDSDLSVVFAHLNEPPPSLSVLAPELPVSLDHVFATALAKAPENRYWTCAELIAAVRSAFEGRPVGKARGKRRLRLLASVGVVLAAAAVAIGLTVSGGAAPAGAAITETSIAGAKLGLPPVEYKKFFGRPWQIESIKDSGYRKLTFPAKKVAVYFRGLTDTAVEITTWNRRYTTASGIGPCSTVSQGKHAYRRSFQPSKWNTINGQAYAYRLAPDLLFAAQGYAPGPPSRRVSAVALYYGAAPAADAHGGALPYAAYITINEQKCFKH